jgi:hypothetical protein
MEQKKRWEDFTPAQQKAIMAGAAVEVALTGVALVSLARRPRSLVRGPKLLWLIGLVVQPFGPLAYLTLGRRTSATPT